MQRTKFDLLVREGLTRSMMLTVDGKDVGIYVEGDPSPLEAVLHSLRFVGQD